MKILLTGATSFTGKQVLPLLKRAGHEIFCLVRRRVGFDNEILWDFLSPLPNPLPPCEAIVNLAAHVAFDTKINIDQYQVNTISVMKLVSYAKKINAFFIQASTVSVFGSVETITEHTPISPINSYGISKYLSDEIIKTFLNWFAILRIGGIYGYNGPSHLGLNNAIRQAIDGKLPPILKGSGRSKRNFVCVLDVAKWIEYLVSQAAVARKAMKEIIYVAGPEVMTIEEYLEKIVEILLPGEKINRIEGYESSDCIIETSPAPFELMRFTNYLHLIKSSRD